MFYFFVFKVLSRLAEKHKSLSTYTIRALCDFLTEPSPLLYKLYRHTSLKIDGQERGFFFNEQAKSSKEYRAFQIFEKLRDAAIEGLCKLVFYPIYSFKILSLSSIKIIIHSFGFGSKMC